MQWHFSKSEITDTVIKHIQIKVLLHAVRDFKPETGDPAYTMSIVDLLLECIELSYRPGELISLFTVVSDSMFFDKIKPCFNLCVLQPCIAVDPLFSHLQR